MINVKKVSPDSLVVINVPIQDTLERIAISANLVLSTFQLAINASKMSISMVVNVHPVDAIPTGPCIHSATQTVIVFVEQAGSEPNVKLIHSRRPSLDSVKLNTESARNSYV